MKKRAIAYLTRLGVQKLLGLALYLLGARFSLSLSAGVYFGFLFAATLGSGALLMRASAETLAERGKVATDSPKWDKALLTAFWLLNYFVVYLIAGLGAGSKMRMWLFASGMALCVIAGYITLKAMLENTYLESTARLQTDRGQTVCQSGPYAFVRHPAYTSILINCAGICLVFQSPGVYACSFVIACIIVVRTYLEDGMLIRGLAGYAAYASKVRFRLIPHIW